MNTLQELRAHIEAAGFESPTANARISAYIESEILNHPNALFKHRVPPLDIIIHAVRSLLASSSSNPSGIPNPNGIPDLLDFATTIEFYRGLALTKLREALTFNGHYHRHGGEGVALSADEEMRLRTHDEEANDLRHIYVEMLLQYCQTDIYYLVMRDPPRSADVTLRLCEYFPALNKMYANAHTSPRLFHFDLDEEEKKLLRERGIDCCRFVRDAVQWAVQRSAVDGQTPAAHLCTPAFAAAFPCPIRLYCLRETMDHYIDAIVRMVHELESMFPRDEVH
ncbi:hypothetical protein C8R43DRAFT_1137690 [Mycena crocata]|nr:hypothetical protein C8R43DRAFT_1137690 [Mycena crocata]